MATVRCQMCQTENPVGEEFCRLCHARLPEVPTAELGPEEEGEQEIEPGTMPDWLSRLREEASGETPSSPPPNKPRAGGELDWLGEMPQVAGEEVGPPAGEVPEWVGEGPAEGPKEEAEVPEWLARIRARAQESGVFERPDALRRAGEVPQQSGALPPSQAAFSPAARSP